jgi:hypothetical protein
MSVQFRAVESDRDPRFPLLPQVSVDSGETWHDVRAAAMTVRESVDDVTMLDLTVFHYRKQAA